MVDLTQWLTTPKAAEALETSTEMVRYLCRQERLVAMKIGTNYLIDPASIERYKARRAATREFQLQGGR